MEDLNQNENIEPAAESAAPTPASEETDKTAEYLAGWQRANADYANLKRDMERMQADFAKYASANLVTSLLPVVDSFKKAHAARPAIGADGQAVLQWVDGIAHIKSQLEGVLAKSGVTAIDQQDVPFDPSRHEAMMMEKAKDDDVKAGTVIRVLEPGYLMHERVLRPAKVVVAE